MSAKQGQITSFFSHNEKQKTNNYFHGNSAFADILSNKLNDIQDQTELCAEMSWLGLSETSALALLTSPRKATKTLDCFQ